MKFADSNIISEIFHFILSIRDLNDNQTNKCASKWSERRKKNRFFSCVRFFLPIHTQHPYHTRERNKKKKLRRKKKQIEFPLCEVDGRNTHTISLPCRIKIEAYVTSSGDRKSMRHLSIEWLISLFDWMPKYSMYSKMLWSKCANKITKQTRPATPYCV